MRGLVTIENIRPAGFEYPTGLNAISFGPTSVDYLVVAGGGGGAPNGGGGGAGGYLTGTGHSITIGTTYTVTVMSTPLVTA